MRVLKFGGTSMGDEHSWRQIMDIIDGYHEPVIIVSATARTTRQLVSAARLAVSEHGKAVDIADAIKERHTTLVKNFLAHADPAGPLAAEIDEDCRAWIDRRIEDLRRMLQAIHRCNECTPRANDAVASIGEQLSAYLFARCGQAYGLSTTWVDAGKVIRTDASYGQAVPDREQIKHRVQPLAKAISQKYIPVMGGYYGQDEKGHTTTLGFEGSDYTASLVGSALQAEAIEIWTDVSGIYTCDPRVVAGARPIPELSFREATELAYFGAKILHPATMKPAASQQIPVYVRNIFEPDHPGTKIHGEQQANGWAKAITYMSDIVILTVTADGNREGHRFLAAVFSALDQARLPVNAVTTTEASVSVALSGNEKLEQLHHRLAQLGSVDIQQEQGLISLIGCSFEQMQTLQERVWSSIATTVPTLISYSRTKRNLNIGLDETELIPSVCAIHEMLFNFDEGTRGGSG